MTRFPPETFHGLTEARRRQWDHCCDVCEPVVSKMQAAGAKPVEILSALQALDEFAELATASIVLVVLLRQLFRLPLAPAKTVAGWQGFGHGAVDDDYIDAVLGRETGKWTPSCE